MNVKKIRIGLLFLILALVVVPGAMALPAYKGTGNQPLPVTSEEAVNCKACHVKNGAPIDLQTCSRCHEDPYPPTVTSTVPSIVATPQMTPKTTKETPDEEETQKETETQEEIKTSEVTAAPTVAATETPTTPGFGIVAA